MEAAKQKAQAMIDDNAVMVFSKSYCPYCRNSKRILDSYGAKYEHYELNEEGKLLVRPSFVVFSSPSFPNGMRTHPKRASLLTNAIFCR